MMSNRISTILVAIGVIVLSVIAVFPAFFLSGKSLSLYGLIKEENLVEKEIGSGVRPQVEGFAFQDAMAWRFVGPAQEFAQREIREGRIPLWVTNIGGGWPILASGSAGVFSLFKIPMYLFPDQMGINIWIIFKNICAGIFAFLWILNLRVRVISALIAGCGFGLSGYMVSYASYEHDPIAFFPLLLFAEDRFLSKQTWSSLLLLAICVALCLISGHPVLGGMVILGSSIYFIAKLVSQVKLRRTSLLMRFFGGITAGVLLGSPIILPFCEFVLNGYSYKMDSVRVVSEDSIERTPEIGLRRLASTFIPHYTEIFRGSDIPGGEDLFSLVYQDGEKRKRFQSFLYAYINWIGVAGVLAFLIFTLTPSNLKNPLFIFTFVGAIILYGIPPTSLLSYCPLVSAIIPRWFSSWVALGMLGLASLSIEEMSSNNSYGKLGVATILYVCCVLIIVFVFGRGKLTEDPFGILGQPLYVIALALIIFGGVWFVSRRKPNLIPLVFLLSMLFDLIISGSWINYAPNLEEHPKLELVLGDYGIEKRVVALGQSMCPNTSIHYDVSDLQAVMPLFIDRYHLFMQIAEQKLEEIYPTAVVIEKPNIYTDLASVEKVIVPSAWRYGKDDPNKVYEGRFIRVLNRPSALPRAYVAKSAKVVKEKEEAFSILRDEPEKARVTPVLEDKNDLSSQLLQERHEDSVIIPVKITKYSQTEVEISVEGIDAGLLVLTDVYYPGWIAEVDGNPTPILPVNLMFRGVLLPSGAKIVRFRYEPSLIYLGCIIAIGTLFVMSAMAWYGRAKVSIEK